MNQDEIETIAELEGSDSGHGKSFVALYMALSPVLKRLSQTEPRKPSDLMPVGGMDEKTVLRQLKEAAELGLAVQGGKGVKNSPLVFLLSNTGQQAV